MKVVAKEVEVEFELLPDRIAAFVRNRKTFITSGKEYAVYAVSVYTGIVFLQIVDDSYTPGFVPACLFRVVDTEVPDEWRCNAELGDDVSLVIGPEYVSRDLASYTNMIDQVRPQIIQFWEWIEGVKIDGGDPPQ